MLWRNGPRAGDSPPVSSRTLLRHAIPSAKHAVEVGHIPEPGIKRNGADLLAGIACVRQQPVRADKALREDILGEGRALAFEQSLDPPRLDPMLRGDRRH